MARGSVRWRAGAAVRRVRVKPGWSWAGLGFHGTLEVGQTCGVGVWRRRSAAWVARAHVVGGQSARGRAGGGTIRDVGAAVGGALEVCKRRIRQSTVMLWSRSVGLWRRDHLSEVAPKACPVLITCVQRAVPRPRIDGGQDFNCSPFSTGAVMKGAGRQLRRSTNKKIKKTAICAGQTQWPGAGSNRRPSDFQDYGNAFVLNRHRP
jgi:hypothetical protein